MLSELAEAVQSLRVPKRDDLRKFLKLNILSKDRTETLTVNNAPVISTQYLEDVGVGEIGEKFRNEFLDSEIAPSISQAEIFVWTLHQDFTDHFIIKELSELGSLEVHIGVFRSFLGLLKGRRSKQSRPRDWHIGYCRGKGGRLWTVYVYFRTDEKEKDIGWYIDCEDPNTQSRWIAPRKIITLGDTQ